MVNRWYILAVIGVALSSLYDARSQEMTDQLASRITKQVTSNGPVYRVVVKNAASNDSAVYALFVPEGIDTVRGVFVHQHGCGMEGRGVSTAYDVQYQAFAKKWGLAIVGPDLYYKSGCYEWRDHQSGSGPSLQIGRAHV